MRCLCLLGLLPALLLTGCSSSRDDRFDSDGATIRGRVFYHRDVFFDRRQSGGWFDSNPAYILVEGTELQTRVRDESSGRSGTYELRDIPAREVRALSAVREGYVTHTIDVRLTPNQAFTFDFDLFPNVTILITAVGAEPASLSVPKGTVITWVNVDDEDNAHRVTSERGPLTFNSGSLNPHEAFSVPLDRTGLIEYRISGVPEPAGEIEVF